MPTLRKASRWLCLSLVACAHPAVYTPSAVARLAPPPSVDPAVPGAAYLTKVAAQFQTGWGQFLNDCRFRLPASHPLNRVALAATAEVAVDRTGRIVGVSITAPSGNPDFDRAVRQVIAEPAALAIPPVELLSDDDRAHLRWLFARDRRQAGPATAQILRLELPLAGVVARLIATGDLARAARRIAAAPPGAERGTATTRVMVAALREALRGLDGSVRRAAVEAVGQARLVELVAEVRSLLTITSDADLRIAAIAAAGELNDVDAAPALLSQLPNDLASNPQLAVAAVRGLVRLGRVNDAAVAIRRALASDKPNPIALEAFAFAPSSGIERKLDAWYGRGTSRIRGAVCAALAGLPPAQGAGRVRRGLVDRDATVRAACAATASQLGLASPGMADKLAGWLQPLTHDRDHAVRARAIEGLASLEPARIVDASGDPAPEVRTAYARALAMSNPNLRVLVADRDPDVRAAAWTALTAKQVDQPPPSLAGSAAQLNRTGVIEASELSRLALQAVRDPSPRVRFAAIAALDDTKALSHIAQTDDAPELRTAGLVQLAHRRGRAQIDDFLLDRLAAAGPGTAERVRVALAWLLAP